MSDEYFAGSPDKQPASARQASEEAAALTAARTGAAQPGSPATSLAAPVGAGAAAAPPSSRFRRYLNWLWSANTFTLTVLSFLLAFVIGGILICISDPEVRATYGYFFAAPGDAISTSWYTVRDAYEQLFYGSIVDPEIFRGWLSGDNSFKDVLQPISETLTYAAPLILTGLAVAVAFRGGLFNIGAQGQAIAGAILATVVGFALNLPPVIAFLVAVIAAVIGGGIWGAIPGVLKAKRGAHEVVTTIMLNYVALLLLNWLILQDGVQDPGRTDAISKPVRDNAELPLLLGGQLRVNFGIILALLATIGMAWVLGRSTFGFELRAVGSNPDAARTAGMSVSRTYAWVMATSGALAGVGGATVVLGTEHTLTGAVVGNIGFDGITVALLGRGKPWGVALAGVLFGVLRAGGNRMQSFANIPIDLVDVLQAIIVLFIAAPLLVKEIFRLRPVQTGGVDTNLAKGW